MLFMATVPEAYDIAGIYFADSRSVMKADAFEVDFLT
jgi:hypothetical protein